MARITKKTPPNKPAASADDTPVAEPPVDSTKGPKPRQYSINLTSAQHRAVGTIRGHVFLAGLEASWSECAAEVLSLGMDHPDWTSIVADRIIARKSEA
jgi:hypothetical protein